MKENYMKIEVGTRIIIKENDRDYDENAKIGVVLQIKEDNNDLSYHGSPWYSNIITYKDESTNEISTVDDYYKDVKSIQWVNVILQNREYMAKEEYDNEIDKIASIRKMLSIR